MKTYRNLHRLSVAATLLLATLPAMAQWTGKGEAGLAVASGNTDTTTANAKVGVTHTKDEWENALSLAGLYVRTSGDTTANRWEAAEQTRYTFGAATYWFGGGRYEEDEFSGFNYQGLVSTGIGHKFFDDDTIKLSAQIGAGYKFQESAASDTDPARKRNGAVGVGAVDFSYQLTATTTLFNRFNAEYTSANTFLQNDIGGQVKVSERVALSVGYGVRYNTDPPDGFKKADMLSTVNLVYEVK